MKKYLFILTFVVAIYSINAAAQTMTPLKSYWCDERVDYFGTATEAGQTAALTAFGCKFTVLEGYVFPTEQPGSVALDLYWNDDLQDNATIASDKSKAELLAAGYRKTASEGFVYSKEQPGTVPLKLYFNTELNDYYSTASKTGEKEAVEKGYKFIRIEGYIMSAEGKDVNN